MGSRDCTDQQSCVDNALNSPTNKPVNEETFKPTKKKKKKKNSKKNRNLRGNQGEEKVNFNVTKGIMHSLEKLTFLLGMWSI